MPPLSVSSLTRLVRRPPFIGDRGAIGTPAREGILQTYTEATIEPGQVLSLTNDCYLELNLLME